MAKLGIKLKKPGLGFIAICVAFILSIVAFCLYFKTYKIEPFEHDRMTITFTIFAMWCMVFLALNMLFKGDKPFWTLIIYPAIAFFLIYALLKLMLPCVNAIGYTLGAGDLIMGNVEKNRAITNTSIMTAVFYVLSAVFVMAAAFMPAEWSFGKKKKSKTAAAEAAETTASEHPASESAEQSMSEVKADGGEAVNIETKDAIAAENAEENNAQVKEKQSAKEEAASTDIADRAEHVERAEPVASDTYEQTEQKETEVTTPTVKKPVARKTSSGKTTAAKTTTSKSAADKTASKTASKSTAGKTASKGAAAKKANEKSTADGGNAK